MVTIMICRYVPQVGMGALAIGGAGYGIKKYHDKSKEEVCTFLPSLRIRLNTSTITTRILSSKVCLVLFLYFFSKMILFGSYREAFPER
jgi:hypothetical protein